MPAPQSRSWLCTLHREGSDVPEEALPELDTSSKIEYVVGQLERAPTTGALHYQFFAYTRRKVALGGIKTAIKSWLANVDGLAADTVHVERCRGTIEQCVAYCTKQDTRVGLGFEYGTKPIVPKSGRELLALFRSGREIDVTDPAWDDVLLRFTRPRLEELRFLVAPRGRNPSDPFICEVHYGPPGSGKSKAVFQSFPTAYIKPSGKWWDHYSGESVVILDDFDGSFFSFGDFKRWVDRYPCLTEVKGGTLALVATHWVITTNVWPSHWWSKKVTGQDGRDAIWRRFSTMVCYSADGGTETVDPGALRMRELFGLEREDPKGAKND